jgi:Family of unknown function (DUF6328)
VSFQTTRARPRAEQDKESDKERTDRQLNELLTELRVALPGAQVLLGFLLTVPFATRFGRVDHAGRIALFACLLSTVGGTLLLMAPAVYHRLRWNMGGKADVVRNAHRFFLAGTALLGLGITASVYLVGDVLFGTVAAIIATLGVGSTVLLVWYVFPLLRGHRSEIRRQE